VSLTENNFCYKSIWQYMTRQGGPHVCDQVQGRGIGCADYDGPPTLYTSLGVYLCSKIKKEESIVAGIKVASCGQL
jgi:hypothetical protein